MWKCPACQCESPQEKRRFRLLSPEFPCRRCGTWLCKKPAWKKFILPWLAWFVPVVAGIIFLDVSFRLFIYFLLFFCAMIYFQCREEHHCRLEILPDQSGKLAARIRKRNFIEHWYFPLFLLLPAVLAGLFALMPQYQEFRLRRTLDEFAAAGIPTTAAELDRLHRELRPDASGYPAFRRAMEAKQSPPDDAPEDLFAPLREGGEIPDENRVILRDWLAANRPALEVLEATMPYESIRFPRDWPEHMRMLLPELNALRAFARLYAVSGRFALDGGDPAAAKQALDRMERLRDRALDDPFLISFLVAATIDDYRIGLFEELLRRDLLSPPELEAEMRKQRKLEPRIRRTFREMQRFELGILILAHTELAADPEFNRIHRARLTRGFRQFLLRYRERMPLLTRGRLPGGKPPPGLEAVEAPSSCENFYEQEFLPPQDKLSLKYNQHRRKRIVAGLGAAYRLGRLPEPPPIDPFGGSPFQIEAGDGGLIVRDIWNEELLRLPPSRRKPEKTAE